MAVHLLLYTNDPLSGRPVSVNDYNQVLHQAQSLVCFKYGIHHTTIQIEGENESDLLIQDEGNNSPLSQGLHCQPEFCRM